MKKYLIILLSIIISASIFSEENQDNLSHYIGGAAGFSTGYGLSYRYWPVGKLGTQVVLTPMSDGEDTAIYLGSGIFKALHDTNYTRLFLFFAGNITYSYYMEDVTDYDALWQKYP